MDTTTILSPWKPESTDEKKKLADMNAQIQQYLTNLKLAEDTNTTFQAMLCDLKITRDTYISAIRYSLKSNFLTFFKKITYRNQNQCLQQGPASHMESEYGHSICPGSICMCYVHCLLHKQGSKRHECTHATGNQRSQTR